MFFLLVHFKRLLLLYSLCECFGIVPVRMMNCCGIGHTLLLAMNGNYWLGKQGVVCFCSRETKTERERESEALSLTS